MAAEKSDAIVLRIVEFSETSVIATFFTRELGKISALAKGARRPKSPFEAALDLLSVCRIVFLHKTSDSLDLLTEARLERRFRAATRDLSRLYAGFYVAELLNELTDTGDPHPELFQSADQALFGLDTDFTVPATVLWFELTALRLLGHLPSLDACVSCGCQVSATGSLAFGQLAGGVLCERCRIGQRQVVRVSSEVIDVLRRFSGGDDVRSLSLDVNRRARGELRGLMNRYVGNLIGRKPRLHRFLGMLAE